MPDRLTPEQIVRRLNDELSVPLSVGAQVFLAQLIAAALAEQDAEIAKLRAEIDAAWLGIENGFDIEPRAELEQQSRTNGFRFGLAQAAHHMWKRDPHVEELEAQLAQAHARIAQLEAERQP